LAKDNASPAVREVVRRTPIRGSGRGRLDALLYQLDAGLRRRSESASVADQLSVADSYVLNGDKAERRSATRKTSLYHRLSVVRILAGFVRIVLAP
jgi:hypothetical protein